MYIEPEREWLVCVCPGNPPWLVISGCADLMLIFCEKHTRTIASFLWIYATNPRIDSVYMWMHSVCMHACKMYGNVISHTDSLPHTLIAKYGVCIHVNDKNLLSIPMAPVRGRVGLPAVLPAGFPAQSPEEASFQILTSSASGSFTPRSRKPRLNSSKLSSPSPFLQNVCLHAFCTLNVYIFVCGCGFLSVIVERERERDCMGVHAYLCMSMCVFLQSPVNSGESTSKFICFRHHLGHSSPGDHHPAHF